MTNQIASRNGCLVVLLIALTVSLVMISGCATTQRTDLWVDSSYHASPMKKIMVIAIRKDQLKRRIWEDAIVAAFDTKEHSGSKAVASYQLFPNDLPDTLALPQRATEEGFDGVLLIARATRDTTMTDVAGFTQNEPVSRFSRRWHTYLITYQDVYHPGYTETETSVSVRTDLLLPQDDGKLVWSVTSMSVDPTAAADFRSDVADRVVKQLKKGHFIY